MVLYIQVHTFFHRMTGVGGRPELVIEGSNDEQDWKVHTCMYNSCKYLVFAVHE